MTINENVFNKDKTNFYDMCVLNKPPLPITVNIVSAYHSLKSTIHKDTNYSNKESRSSDDNDLAGFVHCIDSQGIIETLGGALRLKKNDFCFIKLNEVKNFNFIVNNWQFFCVWFHYTALNPNFNIICNFELTDQEYSDLFRMMTLLHNDNYLDQATANAICQQYVCQFIKKMETATPDLQFTQFMTIIASSIHKNLHNNISISALAQECGYSPTQFRVLFKKHFNMSPKAYILKAKLENAQFLLANSSDTIAAISESLSFNSPSHFIECFKKYFGFTPSEYRKNKNFRKTL